MKVIFYLLIVVASLPGQDFFAKQKTNLQIADSLVSSVLSSNLERIRESNRDSLAIDVSHLEPVIQNYLRGLLTNWFLEKSFHIFRNYNSGSSFQGLVLEISRFNLQILYSKPYEKNFLGSDYVQREVSLKFNGQFYLAGNEEVLSAVIGDNDYSDEIRYADISDMEDPAIPFPKGKRTDYSFWEKVFEPVLAVTAVAALVYMFFSQRT